MNQRKETALAEETIILKIDEITCNYGAFKALDGCSFAVSRGDFMGVIGPNGSGKTTLLRTISWVLKPLRGMVYIDGQPINQIHRNELAKLIGVVPQAQAFDFEFTVLEIVLMGRSPYLSRFQRPSQKDLEVAEDAMKLTNTVHLADRFITQLSGGEQQRVIIARALAQEPQIILLDEPTVHLDINYQIEILDLIKRLTLERNLTVMAVLHDLNLASLYCNYLVFLKDGKVFAIGSPQEVISKQNIKEVYGTDVIIRRHPVSGKPYITLLSRLTT